MDTRIVDITTGETRQETLQSARQGDAAPPRLLEMGFAAPERPAVAPQGGRATPLKGLLATLRAKLAL